MRGGSFVERSGGGDDAGDDAGWFGCVMLIALRVLFCPFAAIMHL